MTAEDVMDGWLAAVVCVLSVATSGVATWMLMLE